MIDNGGFTLGDKTAKELGARLLRTSKRPFVPGTTDATMAIAGRHGAFDFGAKLNPALFALDCMIHTRNAVELQRAADQWAAHLLDASGNPRTMELIFDLRPDKYYSTRYSGSLDFDRVFGLGTFTLPLVAYDPFAYGRDLSTELTWDSWLTMDNEIITFDDGPPTIEVTAPGTFVVKNYGVLEVWPLIQIVGSFTTLSVSVAGRTLVYNEAVSSGTVTLDCAKLQAKLNGANKNSKVSGQWPKLLPGSNNVQIGGSGLNCSVSFIFRAKYA